MTEKTIIELLNQLFEIEKKTRQNAFGKIDRNVERMKWLLEAEGYSYTDPTGEEYSETRTDCQATILSDANPMIIGETIKPVIHRNPGPGVEIIQQARVIIS